MNNPTCSQKSATGHPAESSAPGEMRVPAATEPKEAGDEPLQVSAFVQVSACIVSLIATFACLRNEIGWQLGIGFLCVFGVHELGHIAVAAYYGIPVTWPIFIPNVGGFVIALRDFKDAKEEAYVALGGPVAGLTANAILHAIGVWRGSIPILSLAIFCYGLHLVNMIPAGMLDGGRVAAFIGRRLWLPGLLGLVCVAYKYSSDSWQEILVALLVLWPAADRGRIVLLEWIRKEPAQVAVHKRVGFFPVAGIALGVLVFGTCGLLLAQKQRHDVGLMRWLDAFVDDPRNWMNPPAAAGGDAKGVQKPVPVTP
jgi:Zn-dependent protease